jgi:hypothetical protein
VASGSVRCTSRAFVGNKGFCQIADDFFAVLSSNSEEMGVILETMKKRTAVPSTKVAITTIYIVFGGSATSKPMS